MIHRHPIMFHPLPNGLGKETCDDPPHIKSKSGRPNKTLGVSRQISSSTAGGRWDKMVLKKRSETGHPHTSEMRGMRKGWDKTIRNINHTTRNTVLHFERDYSSRSLIGLPPPI